MAGEEHRHGLVAELAVGHAALAVLVARGEQAGEQVAGVMATGPTLADHPIDDLVDPTDRAPVSPGRGQRQPFADRGTSAIGLKK